MFEGDKITMCLMQTTEAQADKLHELFVTCNTDPAHIAHNTDPRISRREEILAAFRDKPLNKQEADALYSELAEIDQALQFHPSDTLNEYVGCVMRSDYEIQF
jgi:hypothetical protein